MKNLIRQYVDRNISRRGFLSGLAAFGITPIAAHSMARSLAPFVAQVSEVAPATQPSWMHRIRGTGGALLVAQLRAAGIKYIFSGTSSGLAPAYDALVDAPDLQLIMGVHEGSLAAMADGYAKASGKTPVVLIASHGLPNLMSQMQNSWADSIPMVVLADDTGVETAEMTQTITKWRWEVSRAQDIPEITRRAFKFASTQPCAPVFVALPRSTISEQAEAVVMDQAKFDVPMKIRPDQKLIEQVARMLLEAKSPLLHVGDEVVWSSAEKEVVELAELLGLSVARPSASSGWSRPFPTRHPLYVGDYLQQSRHPESVDLILNLGSKILRANSTLDPSGRVKLVQVRMNPDDMAGAYPSELFAVADVKLATADLLSAIKSLATPTRLKQLRDSRFAKASEYTSKLRTHRQAVARSRWDESSISLARLGLELEEVLEKDTCFLTDPENGRASMYNLMEYGGDDKQFFSQGGIALGWSVPAAFGVKLALPDRPVTVVTGDGAFLFSGPQPLWSMARYHAPVSIMIVNNRSYNRERSAMWGSGGRMFQTAQDMACYLGNPDVDYAKMAASMGVEGELVPDSAALRPALERAKRANEDGRPYLLDIQVDRHGLGATSTWHPPFSVADIRKRKV